MKALTLWEPYATLVALGVKRIETRSWPCPPSLIGQRIAIHAAARKPKPLSMVGPYLVSYDDVSFPEGPHFLMPPGLHATPIPLNPGHVVCTAVVAACLPMVDTADAAFGQGRAACDDCIVVGDDFLDRCTMFDEDQPAATQDRGDSVAVRVDAPDLSDGYLISSIEDQWPFGDFALGRWGLMLEDVRRTDDECPVCADVEVCGQPIGTAYGDVPCTLIAGHDDRCNSPAFDDDLPPRCKVCRDMGGCPPIPARGRQRVWEWTDHDPDAGEVPT